MTKVEQLEKKPLAIAQEWRAFEESSLPPPEMTRAKKPGVVKQGQHSCKREVSRDESPERESITDENLDKPYKKRKPLHHGRLDNNEVESPDNVLLELHAEFGGMFDPCPFVGKGCKPDFDGLKIPWQEVNFVNPPYDNISPWMEKAIQEKRADHTTIVFVPSRPGTKYWQKLVFRRATEVRFLGGRIIFKGYKTPPPHHLAFIIYKGETEIKAERLNSNWRLTEILKENPNLQERYPLLYRIISVARPTRTSYKNLEDATQWITPLWSLTTLMEGFDANTLPLSIKTHVLPLFLDMLEVYGLTSTIDEFEITADAQHILPELLRRAAYQFANSESLIADIRAAATEPSESELLHLISFYEVFSTNALIRHLNTTRQYHKKASYDGKFMQQVFIK
jgi:hypothetical protein